MFERYGFFREVVVPILIIVVCILAILYGAGVFANAMSRYQCDQYEKITEYPTTYSNWDTCYVDRDGRMWRWDEYVLAYATTAKQ